MPKPTQAYAECKVFRHWWQPTTVTTEGQFFIQHMVCQRCAMLRRWRVNRVTGDPAGNSYSAPPDYYQHTGHGQQARKELRLREIERSRTARNIRRVV